MIWKNYRLDCIVSKTREDITLWNTDKGVLEIDKDTLAIPILLDNQPRGYVFHGHGKLLLDTLVETEEGALGKTIEREFTKPFAMLGDAEKTQRHLTTVDKEDLTKMGYEESQGLIAAAEDLLHRLFRGKTCESRDYDGNHGFIFAFPNEKGELDILVTKGSKLVYKAADMVFVSDRDKVVLRNPDEVIVSHNGKSLIIKK